MNDSKTTYPQEVTDALKNEKVKALFEMIEKQTPISFVREAGKEWTTSTIDGVTTIGITSTNNPIESLAHELLHAELKIAGYQQLIRLTGLVSNDLKTLYKNVLSILDNELQHHRMFNRFIELGLFAKHFYNDSDKHTYKKVRRALEKMKASDAPTLFLCQFVTIIAPGGAGDEKERLKLKNYLKTRCSSQTWQILTEIESLIFQWSNCMSMDSSECIRGILRLLAGDDKLWFGPANCSDLTLGHYVNSKFTLEEAAAYPQF